MREAFRTLSDAARKQRYDTSIEPKVVPAINCITEERSGSARWVVPMLLVIAVGAGGWYYAEKQSAANERLALELRAKEEALARMEEERKLQENEATARTADNKRRRDDYAYQAWRDQTRREGTELHRRNELERQQNDREEQRQRKLAEQQVERERATQDSAARRRLEEEKRRLQILQQQNHR